MTHQEIKALAGQRAIPPWIMKLVCDAIAIEREACAKMCAEDESGRDSGGYYAEIIRARGQE